MKIAEMMACLYGVSASEVAYMTSVQFSAGESMFRDGFAEMMTSAHS